MSVSEPSPGAGTAAVAPAAAAAGAAAGGAAGTAAGAAGIGAGLASLGAGAVAAGAVIAALIAFLALLRETHRRWLTQELGRFSKSPDDIAEAIAEEMRLEEAFAQNSADRLAVGLPEALKIEDPARRSEAVQGLLEDEKRYAQQRQEAMAARAIAAVTRAQLRRDSPLGAWWVKGYAKDPTPGCVFMAGGERPGSARFWPWAVIDRVHPPRHYGCPDALRGFGEGVAMGLGGAGAIPNTRDAIRAAAGVVMEQEDADALLRELDVRELLAEQGIDTSGIPWQGVAEDFNPGEPRGFHGRWVGGALRKAEDALDKAEDAAAALKRGEPSAIKPEDAPKLIDSLADGKPSSLHLLQVGEHPSLFRAHARELSRAEMPQVRKADLPGFMDFLRSKRIGATVERVAPSDLRATQNQINGAAVAALAKGWDPGRGGILMISKDGDVLDGHHRWAAAALHEMTHSGYKVDVLRFRAGTDRILSLMRAYNELTGAKRRAFGEGSQPIPRTGAA